jgi:hypothetical protein
MASNLVRSNPRADNNQGLHIKMLATQLVAISNSLKMPLRSMPNQRINSLQQAIKMRIASMPNKGINSLRQAIIMASLDTKHHMELQIHTMLLHLPLIRPIQTPLKLLLCQGQLHRTSLNQERANIGLGGRCLSNMVRTRSHARQTISEEARCTGRMKSEHGEPGRILSKFQTLKRMTRMMIRKTQMRQRGRTASQTMIQD